MVGGEGVWRTVVLTGPSAARHPGLAALHARRGVPVTARGTWLEQWALARPGTRVLVVTVERPGGGTAGAAALAVTRTGPLAVVRAWGDEDSDEVHLPADPDAVGALAGAVEVELAGLGRPWALRLEQLPVGDPVAAALATRLPRAEVVAGDGSPVTVFGEPRTWEQHVTRNGRRSVGSGRKRLERDGVVPRVEVHTTPAAVAAELDGLERLRRLRDHDLGRPSALARPHRAAFFRGATVALAAAGELELTTARVDGALAAYVIALRDGRWLRLWDGRFDPAWGQYGLGRVLDAEVLTRALADPALDGVDWMRGEEDYKARSSTAVVAHEHLQAWSSPAVRALTTARPRAVAAARAQLHARPGVHERWTALKRRALRRGQ